MVNLHHVYCKQVNRVFNDGLVQGVLPMVISIARGYVKFLNPPYTLSDLICAGNEGVIEAREKFDSAKGCKFSYYSTFWIRKKIREFLSNQFTVHIPFNRVQGHLRNLRKNLPTDTNLAANIQQCTVDDDASDGNDTAESIENKIITTRLKKILKTYLSDREYKILILYYCEELTLEEISKIFQVTKEAIRQTKGGALRKIRSRIKRTAV